MASPYGLHGRKGIKHTTNNKNKRISLEPGKGLVGDKIITEKSSYNPE